MSQIEKKTSIASYLAFPKVSQLLEETLKDRKSEFAANLIALTDSDANLAACDPAQLIKVAMNATALNLPLSKSLGYAYIIPYKGMPSFQIGYKGLIQLAIRSGQYEFLNATEIREGEIIRNKVTGEIHFTSEKPDNKVVGYLAYLKLKTGFSASVYMSESDIEKHATKYSKMYQSDKNRGTRISKWSDPDDRPKMALKTVLKSLLSTYGLLSTELQKAFENERPEAEYEQSSTGGNRSFNDYEIIQQDEPGQIIEANQEQQLLKL